MSTPIADDFAAIAARMREAEEKGDMVAAANCFALSAAAFAATTRIMAENLEKSSAELLAVLRDIQNDLRSSSQPPLRAA